MKGESKKKWRKKVREYLAAAFGGKCTVCGYNRTIAAFDYHHIDPAEKDHGLFRAMRDGHSWSKIVVEARKCTLVCCRCHRELHAGVVELPNDYAKFNEEYADIIKIRQKEFEPCPICGVMKNVLQQYCSNSCSGRAQRKMQITKDEMEKLIEQKTYTDIGKMFGVSSNAVRKRCKVLGIDLPPKRGLWAKEHLTKKNASV